MRSAIETALRQRIARTRKRKALERIVWAKAVLKTFNGPGGIGRYSDTAEAKQMRRMYLRAYFVLWYRTEKGRATQRRRSEKRKEQKRITRSRPPGMTKFYVDMLSVRDCFCFYCKRNLKPWERTGDHYIPLSKGGEHSVGNMRIACLECNIAKSDMMPEEFVAKLVKEAQNE